MLVHEILTIKGQALFTITPRQSLAEAAAIMNEENVGSLVVFDHGKMVGLLTFHELLCAIQSEGMHWQNALVHTAMLMDPQTAEAKMTMTDLREAMVASRQRYLPVMDENLLLGVVSFHDVAKAVLEEQNFENKLLKNYIRNWPEEDEAD